MNVASPRMQRIFERKQALRAERRAPILSSQRAGRRRSLARALRARPGILAEFKRASPTIGPIALGLDPVVQALRYERGGAAAISVLTEETAFGGSLEDLARIREAVSLPVLRKDFLLDDWDLEASREAGADVVLLIATFLPGRRLGAMISRARELGMEALVEIHALLDLRHAMDGGAAIIGVNNRDLRTLRVDPETCLRLAPSLPAGVVRVAESGVSTTEAVLRYRVAGYHGCLVGTSLMRAKDPVRLLSSWARALARRVRKA